MLLSEGARSEEGKGLHRAELFSIRSDRASITRTAGKRGRDAREESAVGSEGSRFGLPANAAPFCDDASGALQCVLAMLEPMLSSCFGGALVAAAQPGSCTLAHLYSYMR